MWEDAESAPKQSKARGSGSGMHDIRYILHAAQGLK